MTIATHHDAKTKVVEWLRNQGAKKFRLVAVYTARHSVGSADSEHFGLPDRGSVRPRAGGSCVVDLYCYVI